MMEKPALSSSLGAGSSSIFSSHFEADSGPRVTAGIGVAFGVVLVVCLGVVIYQERRGGEAQQAGLPCSGEKWNRNQRGIPQRPEYASNKKAHWKRVRVREIRAEMYPGTSGMRPEGDGVQRGAGYPTQLHSVDHVFLVFSISIIYGRVANCNLRPQAFVNTD